MWGGKHKLSVTLASTEPFDSDNGTPLRVDTSTRKDWETVSAVRHVSKVHPSAHCAVNNVTMVMGKRRISAGFVQRVSSTIDRDKTFQTPIDVLFEASLRKISMFVIPDKNAIRTELPPVGHVVIVKGTLLRFSDRGQACFSVLGRYFDSLESLGRSVLDPTRELKMRDIHVRVESNEEHFEGQCLVQSIQPFLSQVVNRTCLELRKDCLPKNIADSMFDAETGEIYGPYKDNGFYKLSKITAVKQLPDSVKASHILIPFAGSSTADATVTQTSEEAKKVADSILSVVKGNNQKFEELAKEMSVDKVSGAKGGDLGWFVYKTMIPEFRDYSFENSKGDMGVVKTQFGYHIIRIDDQKNIQRNVQVATFSRKIDPSEKTENDVFEKAETFASEISSGKDMDELAKEQNLTLRPVLSLKVFDDNIAELGSQRQIVRWTFEENSEEGNVKRFDVDNGYAVVMLTSKNKAGLSGKGQNVRNILLNEKKAALIKERSTGTTLDEIAEQNQVTKRTSLAVSNTSPVFAGVGRFVDIAGVVTALDENELAKNIVGKSGVAFALVTKKTMPTELQNYNANKLNLERSLTSRSLLIFEALKENSDIEDNRAKTVQ